MTQSKTYIHYMNKSMWIYYRHHICLRTSHSKTMQALQHFTIVLVKLAQQFKFRVKVTFIHLMIGIVQDFISLLCFVSTRIYLFIFYWKHRAIDISISCTFAVKCCCNSLYSGRACGQSCWVIKSGPQSTLQFIKVLDGVQGSVCRAVKFFHNKLRK